MGAVGRIAMTMVSVHGILMVGVSVVVGEIKILW